VENFLGILLKFKMSDSEGETYEKQVKIVLVGDGSSGKVR
jgi:GTPase SAR1 family protein